MISLVAIWASLVATAVLHCQALPCGPRLWVLEPLEDFWFLKPKRSTDLEQGSLLWRSIESTWFHSEALANLFSWVGHLGCLITPQVIVFIFCFMEPVVIQTSADPLSHLGLSRIAMFRLTSRILMTFNTKD